MRIILKSTEFHVFKDVFYTEPSYYYQGREGGSLADKFFAQVHLPRNGKQNREIVEMLINSPNAPALKNAPMAIEISQEEQVADFLHHLAMDYDIHLDERGRFYTNSSVQGFGKKTTEYFSFKDMVLLYNAPHNFRLSYFKVHSKYIAHRYQHLDKLNKKYAVLDLKRLRGGKIISDSKVVVTIPTGEE